MRTAASWPPRHSLGYGSGRKGARGGEYKTCYRNTELLGIPVSLTLFCSMIVTPETKSFSPADNATSPPSFILQRPPQGSAFRKGFNQAVLTVRKEVPGIAGMKSCLQTTRSSRPNFRQRPKPEVERPSLRTCYCY